MTRFEECDNRARSWTVHDPVAHDDAGDMWAHIGSLCRKGSRTVAVAHNIGFDLRVSGALRHLPAQGWAVDLMSIGGKSLSDDALAGGRQVLLVDFMAWVPMGLQAIGTMVGHAKPPLPEEDDSYEAWVERCTADVEILRLANRERVDWIVGSDLGNWQRTGAGQAWSTWRHAHMSHRVTVHDDAAARDAEIAAISTGRCEVWKWGDQSRTEWIEWDLPARRTRGYAWTRCSRPAPSGTWSAPSSRGTSSGAPPRARPSTPP